MKSILSIHHARKAESSQWKAETGTTMYDDGMVTDLGMKLGSEIKVAGKLTETIAVLGTVAIKVLGTESGTFSHETTTPVEDEMVIT